MAVLESVIQGMAGGAPVVVSNASAMTDTDQIYVLSTNGRWYYYDGSAWVAGGEYGGVADGSVTTDKLADGAVTAGKIASGVIPAIDTTLTQPGMPADAKAVGDALAEAMTGEALEDDEIMKYALSSKYDDFKLVDGYGYFDAVKLLNSSFDFDGAPQTTGNVNYIFRFGHGKRLLLGEDILNGLFSPDSLIKEHAWDVGANYLPEGYWITKDPNPIRTSRYITIPKSAFGDSGTIGNFFFNFLDGNIRLKMDTEHMTVLDLDAKFLAITAGSGYSTVTIEGAQFYTGQLNTGYVSDFLGMTDNQSNRYRLWNTFGLFYQYSYAKECMWFASGFNQQRIFYRVKADAVDGGNNAVDVVNYLINKRHLKFYYMQEVTE